MAVVSVQPEGSATIGPSATNFTLAAVIGGTGEVDDNSDATYVEPIRRVVSHSVGGSDVFDHTNRYIWGAITPASELGDWPGEGTLLTWRARVEVAANAITYDADNPPVLRFMLTRASDDIILANFGAWEVPADADAGPQWVTGTVEVGEDEWEALRTGVYPGWGDVGFSAGWTGSPATTLTNDIGDETRVRLYEFAYEYITADEEVRVTRLYPRDDAHGLGSAPRLYPPPRGGRVVGGYN